MGKGFRKYIYIACVLLVYGFAEKAVSGEIKVYAQVSNSDTIYAGESFSYYVVIEGDNRAADVDLSSMAKYEPVSIGNKDYSQTSVSIINGRTTRQEKKQFVMGYGLTVNVAGVVTLPSVKVEVGGQTYATNPVAINVVQPAQSDKLELDIRLSENKCFVGQAIFATVKFYVLTNIGSFNFDLPIFDENLFYIEEPDAEIPGAREYMLRSGVKVNVVQKKTTRNGRDAIEISFTKVLIPKKAGVFDIAASTVSADVIIGRSRGNFFFDTQNEYKKFMTKSNPSKIEVLDLPQDSKPAGFYGLVGKYDISASAEPVDVSVGDPITLTIKIKGRYLKPVLWPRLESIEGFAEKFKISAERSSPKIENKSKVFTQTIRPAGNNVLQIPAIPLAYFDPEKRQYVVVESEPVKLNVSQTKILTGKDLEGFGGVMVSSEVEAVMKGLSANYQGADVLEDMKFSSLAVVMSPGYVIIWVPAIIFLAASIVVKIISSKDPAKIAARDQRRAAKVAVDEIRNADADIAKDFASAMKKFVGRRFTIESGSLTCQDCYRVIAEKCGDEETAAKFRDQLFEFEEAIYCGGKIEITKAQREKILGLIKLIDKKAKA
ncbi:MAG: BatD family protein [Anaerohalosphaeraceae bacterium]|nr:BatD family protein [Anaerohalosphaeraceae bacterium]